MGRYLHNQPLDEIAPDIATRFEKARRAAMRWTPTPPTPTHPKYGRHYEVRRML